MTYAIITSKDCPAGRNIKAKLLDLFDFKDTGDLFDDSPIYEAENCRLYTANEKHIFCEHIDERIPEDKIIFPSTHRSEQGVKSLCVHVTGNWGDADLGGEPRFLCPSMPSEMRTALLKLNELADEEKYQITIEATHHGPAVNKPVMFIEIGSNEEDWSDDEAGTIIAKTIMHTVNNTKDAKAVAILGGGHYNQVGNKIIAKTDYAVGHICPKHSLQLLTESLLKQAIEKTPNFELVILDWKGLGTAKQQVVELLETNNIKFERYKNFVKD